MLPERVTVLGGGNTAFSVAANLALGGSAVLLWEHPTHGRQHRALRDSRTIHLDGTERTGAATLAGVTTDIAEALAWSDVVLLSAPAYAHRRFAEACAPHLRPGHIVALLPGTLGALEFAQIVHQAGARGVTTAEVDTSPYVCRKTAPDRAVIWGAWRRSASASSRPDERPRSCQRSAPASPAPSTTPTPWPAACPASTR